MLATQSRSRRRLLLLASMSPFACLQSPLTCTVISLTVDMTTPSCSPYCAVVNLCLRHRFSLML
ncbi:hypothetical protein PanWU01x14_019000, partial [Parasponia andersonii]